jgi:hypothetical protein
VVDQSAESYAATFDTNVSWRASQPKHEMRIMLAQGNGNMR